MPDLEERLEANRIATKAFVGAIQSCAWSWTEPTAPGKWSPSQIVEHVALTLEESANVVGGRPTRLPKVPAILRPVARFLLFRRVLKKGGFPKARTNKEMDPDIGPPTVEAGSVRLIRACESFERECRAHASRDGDRVTTPFFGQVSLPDYVRFVELHTRHHTAQIPSAQ